MIKRTKSKPMIRIYNRKSALKRITILKSANAKKETGNRTDMQCIFDKTLLAHD